MKLILSPKDNLGKMTLTDVQSFALEGATLLVVFNNGRTRNYPLTHLWYYESHVDFHKTEPLSSRRDTTTTFIVESATGPALLREDGNSGKRKKGPKDDEDEDFVLPQGLKSKRKLSK